MFFLKFLKHMLLCLISILMSSHSIQSYGELMEKFLNIQTNMHHMSCIMRKPAFCIHKKNKDQDQLCCHAGLSAPLLLWLQKQVCV